MPILTDANPSLIEKLLDALNIAGPAKTASSIIIALGVILICGFLMTRLTKLLRLPNATAYIVTGILIGPSVINLIPQEFISRTDFISDIALVFIAFTAGEFFKIREIKKSIGKVLIITAIEAVASFALVFVLCAFVFHLPVPLSLLLAALSSATAPTSTIMTIKQTKSKGHYVNMLLQVIVVDSIISLLLYTVSVSICIGMKPGATLAPADIAWPIAKMLICLVIGVIFGFVLRFLISSKRTTDNRLIVVIAVLLLFCGICSLFGQSPLLGGIAIGLVYTNMSKGEDKIFAQVNYFIPPIMLVFFVRGGMNLDFSNFGKSSALTTVPLIVIVLGFLVARFIGKFGGSFLGSLATRQPKDTRKYLGLGLIPQASVAIALATLGARALTTNNMEEEATLVMTVILASSIIFEIIGPACAKLGLYLTKSYGHDDINEAAPEHAVKDKVVADEGSSKEIDLLAAQIKHISEEIPPIGVEEAEEKAFTEAAEEYENEVFIRNHRGFINRK